MTITIESHHNGITLSTIHNGRYWHRIYQGYTRREARSLFREYVRTGK